MLRGGLSSVSFRNEASDKVVALARGAGLGGIEWSADTHAPHGDLRRAEGLLMETLRAGLTVTSYGSFYRLGENDVP
jgi:3-dehydroshikimate dehydratase